MAHLLLPWIAPWLADWKPHALKGGYEDLTLWQADWKPHDLKGGYEDLILVAWIFSDLETYTAIARNWVMRSTLDIDGNLVMGSIVLKHEIMPPGALGMSF